MPGAVSRKNGLEKNANSTSLIGQAIRPRFRTPARPGNLNCQWNQSFAVPKATDGEGTDRYVAFGVILGPSVGGGLAIDAQSWVGPNAITGE